MESFHLPPISLSICILMPTLVPFGSCFFCCCFFQHFQVTVCIYVQWRNVRTWVPCVPLNVPQTSFQVSSVFLTKETSMQLVHLKVVKLTKNVINVPRPHHKTTWPNNKIHAHTINHQVNTWSQQQQKTNFNKRCPNWRWWISSKSNNRATFLHQDIAMKNQWELLCRAPPPCAFIWTVLCIQAMSWCTCNGIKSWGTAIQIQIL